MGDVQISEADKKRVELVWNVVFKASGKILLDAKVYGFHGLGDLPAPNIHDMVRHLKVYGALIEALYDASDEYEQQRQLLNAKRQITNMEQVALALLANRRDDYEKALADLESQCVF